MPYTASKPRIEFDAWVGEAFRLIDEARARSNRDILVKRTLLSACIFLTHARFETFYKDLICSTLKDLESIGMQAHLLPGRLRAAHMHAALPHDALRAFYVTKDQRRLLDILHDHIDQADWSWTDRTKVISFRNESVLAGRSYPSKDNIKQAFAILGIDIYIECDKRMRTSVARRIDEINGLRGSIAHEGLPPSITVADIKTKVKTIKKIVEQMDRITADHCRAIPRPTATATPPPSRAT